MCIRDRGSFLDSTLFVASVFLWLVSFPSLGAFSFYTNQSGSGMSLLIIVLTALASPLCASNSFFVVTTRAPVPFLSYTCIDVFLFDVN